MLKIFVFYVYFQDVFHVWSRVKFIPSLFPPLDGAKSHWKMTGGSIATSETPQKRQKKSDFILPVRHVAHFDPGQALARGANIVL